MKPFYSFIAAAVVLSLPVTSTALRGQVLSASTPVTSDASVLTIGTEVLGIETYPSSTLNNGVVFEFAYASNYTIPFAIDGPFGSAVSGSTGLSSDLATAFDQAYEGSWLTLTIQKLTPGQVYVAQLFAAMTDTGILGGSNSETPSSFYSDTETVTDVTPDLGANNPSTTLEYGQGYGNSTGTYSVTDTFTAPSTGIEEIDITGGSNGVDLLNAFQVREIPEPSTWAMMLAGLAFLGFRIRRRSIFRS